MANRLTHRKIEQYHCALGRFVSEWAAVETFLDLLILVLAKSSRDSNLPHQLSAKIKKVRTELKASKSEHAPAALRLIDDINVLAKTRHDLIHGSIIGHTFRHSKITGTLGRLLQPPNTLRQRPAKVTIEQLTNLADRLREIGDLMLDRIEQ